MEWKKIGDWVFSSCAELPSIVEWKRDGETEWVFDENNGRFIKGKGKLEDYRDGIKSSRMKDYLKDNPFGVRDTRDI